MESFLQSFKNIKGIVQVGANTGQEIPIFTKFTKNILLFEPIPEHVKSIKQNYPECIIFPYALGSANTEMFFYESTNNGESSSLLVPAQHTHYYPDVKFLPPTKINVKTGKTIIEKFNLKINEYNVLVTDTQGYDLEVIKGFEEYLNNFELIILEYINIRLYENCSSLLEIELFLSSKNFKLFNIFDEVLGAGNAAFIKNV